MSVGPGQYQTRAGMREGTTGASEQSPLPPLRLRSQWMSGEYIRLRDPKSQGPEHRPAHLDLPTFRNPYHNGVVQLVPTSPDDLDRPEQLGQVLYHMSL